MNQHFVQFEGRSGTLVHLNPLMLVMADAAVEATLDPSTRMPVLDSVTGAPTMSPLPGFVALAGLNFSVAVRGTVEGVVKKLLGGMLVFDQKALQPENPQVVAVNPRWICGIQQNMDGKTPLIGQTVLQLATMQFVVDGNMGEVVSRLEEWWRSNTD